MKTRIHVNQHNLRKNRKDGCRLPVITAKTYKDNNYGFEAHISGDAKVIYSPDKPLSCGAVLWIETEGKVQVI